MKNYPVITALNYSIVSIHSFSACFVYFMVNISLIYRSLCIFFLTIDLVVIWRLFFPKNLRYPLLSRMGTSHIY